MRRETRWRVTLISLPTDHKAHDDKNIALIFRAARLPSHQWVPMLMRFALHHFTWNWNFTFTDETVFGEISLEGKSAPIQSRDTERCYLVVDFDMYLIHAFEEVAEARNDSA